MAIYTVHAGHAAQGNPYSGASGLCHESVENRKIKDFVIKYLRQAGHIVYDCTVDSGTSQSNIIMQIKEKINSHMGVTANISIHLNCYNGSAKGTECCVYSAIGNDSADIGKRICANISAAGFINRGNKSRTDLGILKGIKNGGMNVLVETFFCDNKDDYELYKSIGADAFGKLIAEAILNTKIGNEEPKKETQQAVSQTAQPQPQKQEQPKTKYSYHIRDLQGALNDDGFRDNKGRELVKDGIYGANTEAALSKVCLSIKTLGKYINVTAWVQCRVGATSDGKFGNNTKNAVIKFQRDNSLAADGIVGIKTLRVLVDKFK